MLFIHVSVSRKDFLKYVHYWHLKNSNGLCWDVRQEEKKFQRFEVLTAVVMKSSVIWEKHM
jgi:hypothetical protein